MGAVADRNAVSVFGLGVVMGTRFGSAVSTALGVSKAASSGSCIVSTCGRLAMGDDENENEERGV